MTCMDAGHAQKYIKISTPSLNVRHVTRDGTCMRIAQGILYIQRPLPSVCQTVLKPPTNSSMTQLQANVRIVAHTAGAAIYRKVVSCVKLKVLILIKDG